MKRLQQYLKTVLTAQVAKAVLCAIALAGSAVPARAGETFAVIGDAGNWDANSKQVRDSIVRSGMKRLVIPGDNLYRLTSTYEAEWSPWSSQGLTFDVVAIGNHHAGYAREVDFFKMPGEYYARSYGGTVRFIVLNSDNAATARTQAAWLDEQLASATEPQVFVIYHHPSLSITEFHKWTERKAFQQAIRPLLVKHRGKITAVLNGHDHIASFLEFDDLPVVVSGAVQDLRPNGPIDDVQEGTHVKTRWLFDPAPHWAKLEVEAGVSTVRFIRASDDRVVCTLQLRSGKKAEVGADCR